MKTLDKSLAMRFNRQISLPGIDLEGQEKLLNARVLLIGVGGLGCAVAQNLVGSGIGELTLVDDDVVEITNIHRQVLHHEVDIGRSKVDSARETLKLINSRCHINTIGHRLDDANLAQQVANADVIVDCTDNLSTRQLLNSVCWQQRKPLVMGAAIRFEGQLMCFSPQRNTPCYQCFSKLFGDQQLSCAEAGVMPPVVTIVGSLQAMEVMKILLGIGNVPYGVLQLFDFKASQWRSFNVNKDTDCPVCAGN